MGGEAWFYRERSSREGGGPVSFARLRELADAGEIGAETLVRCGREDRWRPAHTVDGLGLFDVEAPDPRLRAVVLGGCALLAVVALVGTAVFYATRHVRPDPVTTKGAFRARLEAAGGWRDVEWEACDPDRFLYGVSAVYVNGKTPYLLSASICSDTVGMVLVYRPDPTTRGRPLNPDWLAAYSLKGSEVMLTDNHGLPPGDEDEVKAAARDILTALRKSI